MRTAVAVTAGGGCLLGRMRPFRAIGVPVGADLGHLASYDAACAPFRCSAGGGPRSPAGSLGVTRSVGAHSVDASVGWGAGRASGHPPPPLPGAPAAAHRWIGALVILVLVGADRGLTAGEPSTRPRSLYGSLS